MKRSLAVLLGASVCANGVLVALLAQRKAPPAPAPAPTPPAVVLPPSVPAERPPAPPARLWDRVRSDNARDLAAHLRAEGVPDPTARVVVAALLRGQYLARQAELLGGAAPGDFWKTAAAAADREKQTALRTLDRDHRDLLAELYGAEVASAEERARLQALYGPLGDDKLARVDRIHGDYGEMADDIRAQAGALPGPTDRETLVLLEQERRKDVAAVLTAEELELYDLQTSDAARTLRARLAAFAPTEKEFRALFALQREFDERFGAAGTAGDEDRQRERTAAEAELAAKVRTVLGAARHEEYLQLQDPGYRMAARIAERFNLPAKRAAEVHALNRATQGKLQALREDKALAPEAARQTIAELSRATGERLVELLGVEGAELYRRTSCGAWLRALERATKEVAVEPVASAVTAAVEKKPGEAPAAVAGEAKPAEPVPAPGS